MTAKQSTLPDLVTSFFTNHLGAERDASGHTIVSYRDTFRLLLRHTAEQANRSVAKLGIEDLSANRILAFLEYLEEERGNSVRTRNARLAAIHSFFSYALTREAALAAQAQRVLAIPFKRAPGKLLGYLSEEELRAILAQPDRTTRAGRRDYLLLALLYDSGARVQELVDLRPADFRVERMPLVRITGKGRKQRIVPLLPTTAKLVRNQLTESGRAPHETTPLLRNHRGQPMTRSGVTFVLEKYRERAAERMPSLRRSGISPHTLRHYIEFRTMSRDVTCLRVQSEIADRKADGISQSRDIVLSALQAVEGTRFQRAFHRSRQDRLVIDDALHPRLLSVQEGLMKGADTMSTWARPFTWKNPNSPDVDDIVRNPT